MPKLHTALTGTEPRVVVIDEFGDRMHPAMSREIVRLVSDPAVNKRGSQLLVATHDTSLVADGLLVKDQVWFTEKSDDGATDLDSLQDFRDVGPDDQLERGYLRGRYGAIPFLGPLDLWLKPEPVGGVLRLPPATELLRLIEALPNP